MKRAVFLDRDGVLNKAIIRNGVAVSPRTRDEFCLVEDAPYAVQALKEVGFNVIVVTNQPDIARGHLSQEDLNWMTEQIRTVIAIDEVLICPHDDYHGCDCRKPKAGMLTEGARQWNIDLSQSFMIGDSWKDIEAGNTAGCTCILINAVYNKDVQCRHRVRTLSEAIEIILGR